MEGRDGIVVFGANSDTRIEDAKWGLEDLGDLQLIGLIAYLTLPIAQP